MKKGDLVKMCWHPTMSDDGWDHGSVIDYKPDVYGGTGTHTAGSEVMITKTPRRGEVLIRSYTDGGISWYDELNVRAVEDVVE